MTTETEPLPDQTMTIPWRYYHDWREELQAMPPANSLTRLNRMKQFLETKFPEWNGQQVNALDNLITAAIYWSKENPDEL